MNIIVLLNVTPEDNENLKMVLDHALGDIQVTEKAKKTRSDINRQYYEKRKSEKSEFKKDFCTKHLFTEIEKPFNDKKKYMPIENLHISAVSEWLKSVITNSFYKQYKITVIPNFVDVNVFKPQKSEEKRCFGNKFIILGVASYWGKGKRLDKFIELANMVDDDIIVVLVGLDSKQRKEVQNNNKIIAIESINSQEDLAKIYNSADVLVNFSEEETFGMVVAESMSCGVPVIVFNSTACPELIADGLNGYIVENEEEILRKILLIKTNGKKYYSSFCREFIVNNFSKDKVMELYSDLYLSILNN